jgi:phosphoglycolate phosphatase
MIILFDLDGTLIDSTEAILESFHNSFDVHKRVHSSDEEIKKLIGYPLDVMYEKLGVARDEVWDYVRTYKMHYRDIAIVKTELLECAREAVISASEFAVLGIVTTKTGLYSKELMEHFDLMRYFKVLVGREDVELPKPDAEPINKALEVINLNVSKEEVWMIGDTKLDLLSAKNAGVNSIGVLSGYDSRNTIEKYTDIVLNDALQAVDYLKSRKIPHI